MNGRIAEFAFSDDALAFRNIKGKDQYEICGGINLPWAVIPRIHYATAFDPFEPPESEAKEEERYDD